jgi:hypothetical protein
LNILPVFVNLNSMLDRTTWLKVQIGPIDQSTLLRIQVTKVFE